MSYQLTALQVDEILAKLCESGMVLPPNLNYYKRLEIATTAMNVAIKLGLIDDN